MIERFISYVLKSSGILYSRFIRERILPYLMRNNHAALYWLYSRIYAEDILYTDEIIKVIAPFYKKSPFCYVDIGCSSGIDKKWRDFPKESIKIYGVDPVREEIDRLKKDERMPNITYHNMFIGTSNVELLQRTHEELAKLFGRFSLHSANECGEFNDFADNAQLEKVDSVLISKITLDDFYKNDLNSSCDFIKIDTDGYDIDVLMSGDSCLKHVIGVQTEMAFQHLGQPNASSFSNIDNYLQSRGFILAKMSPQNSYSLKELPASFEFNMYAETTRGIPWQCDGVYLRDLTTPEACREFGEMGFVTLCKALSLYVFFDLHDWAARLLLGHKDIFQENGFSVDELLNMLTPKVFDCKLSYQQYMDLFKGNPSLFLRRNTNRLRKEAKRILRH